ncbi:hypothetical protein Bbelb_386940 [Branchiostoma belcheri]|nr:hypothetical protein Bbelb_386940 [Branchiostoma belcheri]
MEEYDWETKTAAVTNVCRSYAWHKDARGLLKLKTSRSYDVLKHVKPMIGTFETCRNLRKAKFPVISFSIAVEPIEHWELYFNLPQFEDEAPATDLVKVTREIQWLQEIAKALCIWRKPSKQYFSCRKAAHPVICVQCAMKENTVFCDEHLSAEGNSLELMNNSAAHRSDFYRGFVLQFRPGVCWYGNDADAMSNKQAMRQLGICLVITFTGDCVSDRGEPGRWDWRFGEGGQPVPPPKTCQTLWDLHAGPPYTLVDTTGSRCGVGVMGNEARQRCRGSSFPFYGTCKRRQTL